jgi:hypothetical protein
MNPNARVVMVVSKENGFTNNHISNLWQQKVLCGLP